MTDKDVDAFRKMRNVKYNNNIEKYVTRLLPGFKLDLKKIFAAAAAQ